MLLRTRRFALPPAGALSSVHREMEDFFGRLLNERPANGESPRAWRAPVAMWQEADKVFIEYEVPGVSKDSVDVTVHNGTMRVTGERALPEGERNYWVNERAYGKFEQSVVLPEDVDADSIDAQLTDGVLRIVLTKRPEAQPKKITLRD